MLKQTDLLVDYYNFNRFLQHITHQSGNTETQKLDGHNKVLREMGAIIEEITNILENFGVDVQLQKLICRYHQSINQQPLKNMSHIYLRKFQMPR